jgi:protein-disulfide isomerase
MKLSTTTTTTIFAACFAYIGSKKAATALTSIDSAASRELRQKWAKAAKATTADEDEVVATPEATEKVNLILLTEAGCPYCQQSIVGPLNDMITSPGFADILIVRQFR